MIDPIRNFGLDPRIGLGVTERVRHAEQVEEELIEEIKKLSVHEQEKLLKDLREERYERKVNSRQLP